MNRRDFLKEAVGAQSDQLSTVVPLPVSPTAGSPRQYRAGSQVLIADVRAWLCRDEVGLYAVDAHCPHLGCLVRPAEGEFVCPCHQSRFSANGERQAGPAPRGLRYLYIELDAAGQLVIRRDRSADPNDRLMA